MSKSRKISFSQTTFFVKGVPKKVVRVKGRKLSSSRKSKGIPVKGIPKKVHRVKGRRITSSKRSSRKKKRKTPKK